jgi:hypothetical protein
MAKIVKYIRQDATDLGRALDDHSTFTIDAPKYLYARFMPISKVPNKRTTTSKAAQHAESSDQVSDRTSYASDSDESTTNHYFGNRKRDRVNQREEEWSARVRGNLVPEGFSWPRNSHQRDDPPFGASSDSLRASYYGSDENPSVGNAFLGLLKAIGRVPRKLLQRQPHELDMQSELVISPRYRRRERESIELTAAEEREAARRARGHWICVSLFGKAVVFNNFADKNKHICKLNGVTTVNLEKGDRLCRRITCRHDHSGCKDCPSRGNNIYSELLEHYKDEIRDELRQREPRR